jgi:tRNA uridine 5-carboxymethylaminomethyl modification enzyme
VLIDDLVTVGSNEPYRMFTSRAEFRLLLREQSADMRLSEYGYNFGLLDEDIYKNMLNKKAVLAEAIEFMTNNWFNPSKENLNMLESLNEDKISNKTLLIDVIGRNTMDNEKLEILVPQFEKYTKYLKDQIVIEAKYYRYNLKQEKQIAKMKKMLNLKIPENFSYKGISGLSNEVVEKLNKYTPTTLFGASQISGITPSAVDIIHLHIANKKG